VNQGEIAQVMDELRRKHPDAADERDLSDFELTLALVPEQSIWRVADRTPAVFAIARGDRRFTVELGQPGRPGLPGPATLTSTAVEADKLLVRLEWGEPEVFSGGEIWRRTHWSFRLPEQEDRQLEEWQQVIGHVRTDVHPQELDRDEHYARGLLARIDRRVVRGEPAAPADQEAPTEAPPVPGGPHREQVTDIWGNPIDKRRRGRR
jgi:hypothetical protein